MKKTTHNIPPDPRIAKTTPTKKTQLINFLPFIKVNSLISYLKSPMKGLSI